MRYYLPFLLMIMNLSSCEAKAKEVKKTDPIIVKDIESEANINTHIASEELPIATTKEISIDKSADDPIKTEPESKEQQRPVSDKAETKGNSVVQASNSMTKPDQHNQEKKVAVKDKIIETPNEIVSAVEADSGENKTEEALQQEPVEQEKIEEEPVEDMTISHDLWDELLSTHVSANGVVNYTGFKKDRAKHLSYLELLAKQIPDPSWSKSESLAYWINAYNAFTVDLIVSNLPVTSITSLDGGKPWDVKRITLAGTKYSLNNIEHDIIRPVFKDARIHFAVNCAAKSCPKLGNKAFSADNLDSMLNRLTKEFVNNTQANVISNDSAQLSKIFEWYAVDFGDMVSFLNKYSNTKLSSGAQISYKDYNWNLNGK